MNTLFTIFAAGTAWWVGLRTARRKGFPSERVEGLLVWILVGAFVGARAFHVIDRPEATTPARSLCCRCGTAG